MLLIRPATVNDVTLLRTLIRELAEFEHELDLCVIEEADLTRDGFGHGAATGISQTDEEDSIAFCRIQIIFRRIFRCELREEDIRG